MYGVCIKAIMGVKYGQLAHKLVAEIDLHFYIILFFIMSRRMYFYIIVVVLFVAALIFAGFMGKNAFLDKMTWLPDEKQMFVDDAKFRGYFRGVKQIYSIFPMGHIVVTNKRILLTQRTIWGGRYRIDYAINYVDKGPELTEADMLGGALLKMDGAGFPTFFSSPERVTYTTEKNIPVVQVTVPFPNHGPLMAEPRFVIYTKNSDQYKQVFSK